MSEKGMDDKENFVLTALLIQLVQDRPFLYNTKDAKYKNIKEKKHAWDEISYQIQSDLGVEMTANQAQKKWKLLRDNFTRVERKLRMFPSGSKAAEKWPYFKSLLFLRDNTRRVEKKFTPGRVVVEKRPFFQTVMLRCPEERATNSNLSDEQPVVELHPDDNIDEIEVVVGGGSESADLDYEVCYDDVEHMDSQQSQEIQEDTKNSIPPMDKSARKKRKVMQKSEIALNTAELALVEATKALTAVSERLIESDSEDKAYIGVLASQFRLLPANKKAVCLQDLLGCIQKYL